MPTLHCSKNNQVSCSVYNEDGMFLGTVVLTDEESHHFDNSGLHNADVSLTDDQQAALGLDRRYDNYVSIRIN